ncbi:hypothetical protein QS257_02995 [Terrilactibacillus sp. S3-3]|nr:hypothetical protein QS257_02995 [Terrilactibacillus sp. S3-3]
MSIITSLLFLPVILLFLGSNINRLTLPWFRENDANPKKHRWYRFTKMIMRRPVFFLVVSLVIIVIFAFPAKELKTFTPDVRILPQESLVRQGYQLIEHQFGLGATNPVNIVIHSPFRKNSNKEESGIC